MISESTVPVRRCVRLLSEPVYVLESPYIQTPSCRSAGCVGKAVFSLHEEVAI